MLVKQHISLNNNKKFSRTLYHRVIHLKGHILRMSGAMIASEQDVMARKCALVHII